MFKASHRAAFLRMSQADVTAFYAHATGATPTEQSVCERKPIGRGDKNSARANRPNST